MLKQVSSKHKHLKELVYREEHENVKNNPRQMSVQLNFKDQNQNNFSLRRVLNPNGVSEYFFNENPLLTEEYHSQIQKLNL